MGCLAFVVACLLVLTGYPFIGFFLMVLCLICSIGDDD